MKGSGNKVSVERGLEEAISKLVLCYARDKGILESVNDSEITAGILKATCEITYAVIVATEFRDLDPDKRYVAWYYISRKGVTGNLGRDWNPGRKTEEVSPLPLRPSTKTLSSIAQYNKTLPLN